MGKVYELAMAERPGLYARTEPWWDRLTHDPDSDTDPPMRCVLAEDDSGPRGYALFTSEGRWERGTFLPDGETGPVTSRSPWTRRRPPHCGPTCSAGT